jgi:Domain of Unknown Function (DUF1080)
MAGYRPGIFCAAIVCMAALGSFINSTPQKSRLLFDGKTFRGWEGDTLHTWRIENGTIAGGSVNEMVPHNNFICTKRNYGNFILRLKVKLVGKSGFINAGVQFRSQRLTNPSHEMIGYQSDVGPGYWGSLYDESRRNKTLMAPDSAFVSGLVKVNDWNEMEIRCENRHIRLYLNGKQTVDYTEEDESLPQDGLIGLQVHGGGKVEVYYKDLILTELP